MADPVVVDDGGSTRIKRLTAGLGVIDNDGLVDVDPTLNPPQSNATVTGPFTHIRVVTIDKTGTASLGPDDALQPNDKFTITSANDQKTVNSVDATGKLTISLQATGTAAPLVEARQLGQKRRYVVANAGPIKHVGGTINGRQQDFDVPKGNIYTAVVLS